MPGPVAVHRVVGLHLAYSTGMEKPLEAGSLSLLDEIECLRGLL